MISWNLSGYNEDTIIQTDERKLFNTFGIILYIYIFYFKLRNTQIFKYSGNFGINVSRIGTKLTNTKSWTDWGHHEQA